MRGIFGCAVHSISLVADNLKERAKIFVPLDGMKQKDIDGCKTADVVLLNSVLVFKRLADKLPLKVVVIVFDSPINLCFIKNIRYLDCVKNSIKDGLSYKWMFKPIDYRPVFATLKSNKQVKWSINEVDLLPVIIDGKLDGKLIPHVNNLIYNSTNHTNRVAISHCIFEWATGLTTVKQTTAKIKKLLILNPIRVKLVETLAAIMSSDYGTKIVQALKERTRLKSAGKSVQYKKLQKSFDVLASDLKGIIILEEN